VLPLFESGIPLLLDRLRQLPDHKQITIAYPDEGAWKRFHYQFKNEGYPEVGGWVGGCGVGWVTVWKVGSVVCVRVRVGVAVWV
jgi:hypothetical protein